MPHALVVALLGLVGGIVGLFGLGWLRWQYLKARPGCFRCSVVVGTGARRHERPGLANFTPLALEWFARNSLNPAAARRWPRRGLSIKARDLAEARTPAWQVVQLRADGATALLVLSASASAGLLSWIEAGPTHTESIS
ncbi:MAG: DUF2550 domain-containing protein [Bifidobacteriaceae bacterium]|jgi:hypothetical protein|nr:DUF2550 domain-containing protein [Bifidobacteriaceae bacterium]